MDKNKVVIVTGGSSGIGAATGNLLYESGYNVMLAARDEAKLKKIVRAVESRENKIDYCVTDVSKAPQVSHLVARTLDKFGHLDVLLNNAGIMPNSPISEGKLSQWQEMVDVNLIGVLNGIATVMPIFKKQKGGQIISTSSVAAFRHYPNAGIYGATKAAVKYLMESIRLESATEHTNIRATSIYPGAINTALPQTIQSPQIRKQTEKFHAKIAIDPLAVAKVIKFAIEQPAEVDVSELSVYPTMQI
ncbi:SDR family oxidoreductase [Pediococcus siamensis]|uniref:SDR family oxidoreductase n=1 Tax=Pediococcus siamensis TaxID=381829 RepID=UPI0039A2823B